MESGGQAGRINVSEVTRALVEREAPGQYKFEDNQMLSLKGVEKESMSYFIDYA
jgi:hypothetical protein